MPVRVSCVVCGSAGPVAAEIPARLLRCPECGLHWTLGDGTESEAEQPYDDRCGRGEGHADSFEPTARRFESQRRLRWLLETERPTSLVEAGCAGGFFLEAARACDIEAEGVDVSPTAAAYARATLGVAVREGRFEHAQFAVPVGAVCAFHVLEHVDDPHEFLAAARRALAPGGLLVLEVPNIASAAARRLGVSWPYIQPRYHRWHFTPWSLGHLVRQHGFDPVSQDTVFSRFYRRPRPRWTHARSLLVADWVASGSPRVVHPELGDAIRLIARADRRSVA